MLLWTGIEQAESPDDKSEPSELSYKSQTGATLAGMAELADAADSKSADLRVLGVQLPLPAPIGLGEHVGERHGKSEVSQLEMHVSVIDRCHRVVRNACRVAERNGQMSTRLGYTAGQRQ